MQKRDEDLYDTVCFHQKTTYHRYAELLLGVDQNVTVINPASFDDNSYECIIDEDGTVPCNTLDL